MNDLETRFSALANATKTIAVETQNNAKGLITAADAIQGLISITKPIAEDVAAHDIRIANLEDNYASRFLSPRNKEEIKEAKKGRALEILGNDYNAYSRMLFSWMENDMKACTVADNGFEWLGLDDTLDKYADKIVPFIVRWSPRGGKEEFYRYCEKRVSKHDVVDMARRYNKFHPHDKIAIYINGVKDER